VCGRHRVECARSLAGIASVAAKPVSTASKLLENFGAVPVRLVAGARQQPAFGVLLDRCLTETDTVSPENLASVRRAFLPQPVLERLFRRPLSLELQLRAALLTVCVTTAPACVTNPTLGRS
jgi:hypothetical protein